MTAREGKTSQPANLHNDYILASRLYENSRFQKQLTLERKSANHLRYVLGLSLNVQAVLMTQSSAQLMKIVGHSTLVITDLKANEGISKPWVD